MKIGSRLLELRKLKGLSQEEVANELNVSRQTISKWETDQSTPDFDKIAPLCNLYDVTADELLTGKTLKKEIIDCDNKELLKKKKAKGIGIGILLYFISISWIMVSIPVYRMNPVTASAIFLIICGVATFTIVYSCIVYKKEKKDEEKKESKLVKQINDILAIIFLIIYLFISFTTMAWHITWIIWIIYALVEEIVKLIFMLRGNNNEK